MRNLKKVFEDVDIFWLILLIVQQYIDGTVLLGIVLLYVLYKGGALRRLKRIKHSNLWVFTILIIFGAIIGLIHIGSYAIRDYLRDIYYYFQPLLYIYAGYIFCGKDNNRSRFYKTFCVAGVIVSLFYIGKVIKNPGVLIASSIIDIRTGVGKETFIVLFTLVILLTKDNIFKKKIKTFFLILVGIVFILQFSRTAYGTIVIILLTDVILQRKITNKLLRSFLFAGIGVAIAVILLPGDLLNDFSSRLLHSFSEVSAASSFDNLQEIESNWRGYEKYLVQTSIESGSLFDKLLGFGFGKTVVLGGYTVDLGGENFQSISTFHNGYIYILLKNGYLGLLLYLYFFLSLIAKNYKKKSYEARMITAFTLGMLFMTYTKGGILRGSSIIEYCFLIGYELFAQRADKIHMHRNELSQGKLNEDSN